MNKKRLFLIWMGNTFGFIAVDSLFTWLTKDASEHFDFPGIMLQGIMFGTIMVLIRFHEIRNGWFKDDNEKE